MTDNKIIGGCPYLFKYVNRFTAVEDSKIQ